MNDNTGEGTATDLFGKAKEALGRLTGNEQQQNEGQADQAIGGVQRAAGNLQEQVGGITGGSSTQDRVSGKVEQALGGVKAHLGDALGDQDLQAEGEAQQGQGTVREGIGNLKDGLNTVLGKE